MRVAHHANRRITRTDTVPRVVARASCFTQRYLTRLQAEPYNYSIFRKILVGLAHWRPSLTYAQEV